MDINTALKKIIDLAEQFLQNPGEIKHADIEERLFQNEVDAMAELTSHMRDVVEQKKIVAASYWSHSAVFVRYYGHMEIHVF